MNFKKIGVSLALVGVLFACNKEDANEADATAQYQIDQIAVQDFLSNHYYDAVNDTLKKIPNGGLQTSLKQQVDSVLHVKNGVNYYVYTLVLAEGLGSSIDDNDIANVNYTGMLMDEAHTVFEENIANDAFFDLNQTIDGWQYGLTKFKGGIVDESVLDAPRTYTGMGKGYLFIPSGLAYGTGSNGIITANSNLMFKMTVKTVSKVE